MGRLSLRYLAAAVKLPIFFTYLLEAAAAAARENKDKFYLIYLLDCPHRYTSFSLLHLLLSNDTFFIFLSFIFPCFNSVTINNFQHSKQQLSAAAET